VSKAQTFVAHIPGIGAVDVRVTWEVLIGDDPADSVNEDIAEQQLTGRLIRAFRDTGLGDCVRCGSPATQGGRGDGDPRCDPCWRRDGGDAPPAGEGNPETPSK